MGGGYEAMQAYESCQLIFMNIENIHRMRESLYSLFNLLKQGEAADRKGSPILTSHFLHCLTFFFVIRLAHSTGRNTVVETH